MDVKAQFMWVNRLNAINHIMLSSYAESINTRQNLLHACGQEVQSKIHLH